MTLRDPSAAVPSFRTRRLVFAASVASAAVLVAALVLLWSPVRALSAPFEPQEGDGRIAEAASLDDDRLPAIAKLDPELRSAMREAAAAAAFDGIVFEVTSGWRSHDYQQWLLDDAIRTYGSEQAARQFVADPDRSSHVTGDAVDIGPVDAQFWLITHGPQWGLCQIYANERWHFELATSRGGQCPELRTDAAG